MVAAEEIERFVRPFYEGKDTMHDLSHIQRILRSAAGPADHYPDAARGQSLEQIVPYVEANVLFRFRYCVPEAQRIYQEQERSAAEFLTDLKNSLDL